MHITLSEEARAWADRQVARAGYNSLDAYIEALVLRDRQESGQCQDEQADPWSRSSGADRSDGVQAGQAQQQKGVALLEKAVVGGPATPMTAQTDQTGAGGQRKKVGMPTRQLIFKRYLAEGEDQS